MSSKQLIPPHEAVAWGQEAYREAGLQNLGEVRVLLEETISQPLWKLAGSAAWAEGHGVTETEFKHFQQLVKGRVARRPLQHLLGKMWFDSLELKSAPGCFIVRPETEALVEAGAKWLANQHFEHPVCGIDLCSGSGAIALALTNRFPELTMKAIELSAEALAVAQTNLKRYPQLAQRIELCQGDATWVAPGDEKGFDLVISNPPYLAPGQVTQAEAQQDPDLALYGGGEDGMEMPLKILAAAALLLRPGGVLIMEHDPAQARQLQAAGRKQGYAGVKTGMDLTGRPRFLQAEMAK